jgi:hypothetical protein
MAKGFTVEGKIKKIDISKGKQITKVVDINLTDNQVEKVKDIIESGGMARVTIEQMQGLLPDGKKAASGDPD